MCPKVACHIFSLEVSTLFVNLGLCAHHYARDAKSALQATACGERIRKRLAFRFIDALQSGDFAPFGFGNGVLARDLGFAVNDDGAAATLASGGAPILGRRDV